MSIICKTVHKSLFSLVFEISGHNESNNGHLKVSIGLKWLWLPNGVKGVVAGSMNFDCNGTFYWNQRS